MKRTRFVAIDRSFRSAVWGGALVALLLAAGSTVFADVEPEHKNRNRSDFGLFSGPTAVLDGNQWQCGIDNRGQVCTDVFGSPTAGGGNWPVGSPNAYIFNTGLQIAGIMGDDGGPWAQDTVGGFFFDATGGQRQGSPLTDVFNSLVPEDAANWPSDAVVSDPDLFNEVLIGRDFASQQDSWVQYWEGDPVNLQNRKHPMGIAVTQRSLAWNFPSGNESIIYFIYTFRNATGDSEFQRLNELQFFGGDNALPDGGITLNEVYAAFGTDMDVTSVSTTNFSTAILPFDLGLSYHGAFDATGEFIYPPDIFFPPFFTQAPGLVGIKYLRSPINPDTGDEIGLTLFSTTIRQVAGALPDPVGDDQLWRYLSGRLDPALGDVPCSIPAETPLSRSLCFIFQQAADTRFYQASGPFGLAPDQEATIVVAYIAAPVVQTMPDGTASGIIANSADQNANPPGTPSFHPRSPSTVAAGVWGSQRGCDATGANCTEVVSATDNVIKAIERGAGWFEYTGPAPVSPLESPDNKLPVIDPVTGLPNVILVPGSLLGRALVAQTIFDNKFLLGFAPDPPAFYLVEGSENVSIVWDASASEVDGDPFYTVASDPGSALFNPNYRQFDVEGYRILRGTESGILDVIAQFDYSDTEFIDSTCETVAPSEDVGALAVNQVGDTVEVTGFATGEICPFGTPGNPDSIARPIRLQTLTQSGLIFNNGRDGGAPGSGVVRTQDLAAVDVGVTDPISGEGFDPLQDTGVPFAWTDDGTTTAGALVNNFTYFYGVQAFDVNSQASGPISLVSSTTPQSVVPRTDAPNVVGAELQIALLGDDGEALDPAVPVPALDPENGTFAGPFPPTNGVDLSFAPLVPRLLPQFELTARIDSVKPDWALQEACTGWAFQSVCYRAYLTSATGEAFEVAGLASNWNAFGRPSFSEVQAVNESVAFDSAALEVFGIPEASGAATGFLTLDESINFINWEGQQNRRGATQNTLHGGPRWFNGTEETLADPTAFIRVGRLAEVDSVFIPIHHTALGPGEGTLPNSGSVQYFGYYLAHIGRAADMRVTWTGGTIEVRDVTHNVDVPFSGEYGSSWGFLNDDGDGDGTVAWWDWFCVGADAKFEWELVFGAICPAPLVLSPTPTIHSISMDTGGAPVPTGNGYTLYLNGMRHFFLAETLPPDGTVWTLRTYSGSVTASAGLNSFDPGGYAYQNVYDLDGAATGRRSPLIPGMTLAWLSETNTTLDGPTDLTQIHTVPDPYLATSALDLAPTEKRLQFVNLPPQASIRIYTLTGILVDQVEHDDPTGGGRAVWDLRNRNQQFVASGVYFFHVITPDGEAYVGKFTVVNFASQ